MPSRFDTLSDAALVIFVSRYEEGALAEVYKRHSGAVFGLGRRLLGDDARAEELVQEVFLRLWNEPTRFDPDRGTLRGYLLVDAHGRAVDVLRADTSRRDREARDARKMAAHSYDMEHEIGDLVVSAKVRTALESLTQDQRQAIEVAYFGGYTYQEVASQLNVPEGTVKSRIRSGLRRLHDELVGAGVEMGT
jgi:RNA polymerase sigma-70 factor (ECF subfamily)